MVRPRIVPKEQVRPRSQGKAVDLPDTSYTIGSPFPKDTTYFEPSKNPYMINLIVDDLEGALKQVAEGGGEVVGSVEELEYGLFAWFPDPEGNKVELWQPSGK